MCNTTHHKSSVSKFFWAGYFSEGETSYQTDDSVDVIDASPEHSLEKIVATKLPEVEALQTTESQPNREKTEQPARVSNLELENKLLRKEVDSLNAELLSLAQRSKDSQESKEWFCCGTLVKTARNLLTTCNRLVTTTCCHFRLS